MYYGVHLADVRQKFIADPSRGKHPSQAPQYLQFDDSGRNLVGCYIMRQVSKRASGTATTPEIRFDGAERIVGRCAPAL